MGGKLLPCNFYMTVPIFIIFVQVINSTVNLKVGKNCLFLQSILKRSAYKIIPHPFLPPLIFTLE